MQQPNPQPARSPALQALALLHGILWVALVIGVPTPGFGGGPLPGREPIGTDGRLHISGEDRCPVCAMLPIRYPRFASGIELRNGRSHYFCSPGCMLKAWLQPDIFLGTDASQLGRPIVMEYLSGEALDARDVFWISGSDVVGPMGPALVPLKGEAHLDAFRRRHGGEQIFRLDELSHENWEKLTGKRAPRR